MEHRLLGRSGIGVSVLSLGSWRTYERVEREQGLAVMRAARAIGVDFLDDARYDDETGRAPVATGYSEIVFGELFRASGWRRDEVVVANKLWWEFWPEQNAERELEESLRRMRFDYVDLIYACWPPPALSAEEIVDAIGGLLRSGKARTWGFVNWDPALVVEACAVADRTGIPLPVAAQLPYCAAYRDQVEGERAQEALARCGAGVVASFALAGGALSGKYSRGGTGRYSGDVETLDDPEFRDAIAYGDRLAALAAESGKTAAAVALAFALHGPGVASVLFGATSPEQVRENARALDISSELIDGVRGLT